jgi:hypothetical protein
MGSHEQQAQEIQARMGALREHMEVSVHQAAASARQWGNWRYYVRRFPLTTTLLAAGVGYMLVPRRRQIVVSDVKSLEKLLSREQLVISQRPMPAVPNSVVQRVLFGLAAGVARATVSYLGGRLISGLTNGFAQARPVQPQPPTDSRQPVRYQPPRYPK